MRWPRIQPTEELIEDTQAFFGSVEEYMRRSVSDNMAGLRRDQERIAWDWRRVGDHLGDVTGQKREDQQR